MKIGDRIKFKHNNQLLRANVLDINNENISVNVYCAYIDCLNSWKGLGLFTETKLKMSDIELIRILKIGE